MVLEGQRHSPVVRAPVAENNDRYTDAGTIHRAKGVPDDITLCSTYVASGQLVYVFRGEERGQWFEYNYTTGLWFFYQLD